MAAAAADYTEMMAMMRCSRCLTHLTMWLLLVASGTVSSNGHAHWWSNNTAWHWVNVSSRAIMIDGTKYRVNSSQFNPIFLILKLHQRGAKAACSVRYTIVHCYSKV